MLRDVLIAQAFNPFTDNVRSHPMKTWTKPEYKDLRFGFEVTMYINNK